jgi:hypothetical protein
MSNGQIYKSKSGARSAAIKSGLTQEHFEVVACEGGFVFNAINMPEVAVEVAPVEALPVAEPVVEAPPVVTPPAPVAESTEQSFAAAPPAPISNPPASAESKEAKPKVSHRGKSTLASPTKAVWHLADEMVKANPNTTRKEVMKAAEAAGIAYYTARTQYQLWLTARRAAAKEQPAVAETK